MLPEEKNYEVAAPFATEIYQEFITMTNGRRDPLFLKVVIRNLTILDEEYQRFLDTEDKQHFDYSKTEELLMRKIED